MDFLGKITKELADGDGRPLKTIEAYSPDGLHLLEIEKGTQAKDNRGNVITYIEIREVATPDLPDNTVLVGKTLDFRPSRTSFDRRVKITLGYDIMQVPDEVLSIGTAFYNAITRFWSYTDSIGSKVADIGRLTAPVDHFTIFAILAIVPAPTPPEPPPTPAPPGPKPAEFELSNLLITPSIVKNVEKLIFVKRTGEEAVISVDVTNVGGQQGNYDVILIINGITRGSERVGLDPGQTETASFTVAGNEPGTYLVQIGDVNGDFISALWINWWLITGFAALFILLCWLAWYLLKGRKSAATK